MKRTEKKPRRKKVTGDAAAAEIAAAAHRIIEPPSFMELDKIELHFFDSIIAENSNADWSDHQIECAALLARTMAELNKAQVKLRKSKREDDRARSLKTIQVLMNSIFSARRSLGLHSRAQGGEARDVGKRRELAKKIESGVKGTFLEDDDDLLARPAMN